MSVEEGSNERRRWKRLRSEIPVELHLLDPRGGGRTMTARGTHMNPEGIFVLMADPPEMGTQVRVTVETDGVDGVLTAEGEVVYRVIESDQDDGNTGCGIHVRTKGPGWNKLYEWLAIQER